MNNSNKVNILLIEDNPADVELLKISLKDSSIKHELFHGDTLFEGVDIATNQDIQLVLLDLTLPDSSGFKTLTSFLEKIENIPVVILTGVNNEIVGNQAIKAGAQDFLVKGQFDGKLLGRTIRYSLHRFNSQLKLENALTNLELSKKKYIEAQEMAHFGNWEMDIVSNKMNWTNEVFKIFGFQSNSLSPTLSDYLEYVHKDDKAEVEQFFEKAAKDGKQHHIEHKIIVSGHMIRYVALRAKVRFEEVTGKTVLVGVIQDISERKISEQLILEKNISQKATKIKEEAISNMNFHIRTPLSSIMNFTYLIEKTSVTNQQSEIIGGLKTSVDDLSLMVNNMLNFSVLVSEEISLEEEEVKLADNIESFQKVIAIKAENTKTVATFDFNKELPEKVVCDPKKILQLLYNLFDSAFLYSDDKTKLHFSTTSKGKDEDFKLCFELKTTAEMVPSVSLEELKKYNKLVEFFSVDDLEDEKKYELGIAIILKLVSSMNGQFEINNTTEGVQYNVEIPVTPIKKLVLKNGEAPEVPVRVLLVEDHFLNQMATKKVLTSWSENISVDIAENGLIGVEKFREHGYDIIIMDIQMPVMNGIEATEKIRENSQVPIIALTANSTKQEQQKCYNAGANEYLTKPFKPQELYSQIMSLLVAVEN